MARMHDVIHKLYIREGVIPDQWEALFIASLHKYSRAEKNKQRYSHSWYRENNFWLSLDAYTTEAIVRVAQKIVEDEALYEWSGFLRYLLFDTKVLHEDDSLLEQIVPFLYLGEGAALFMAVSFVANIDQVVHQYRQKHFEETEIKNSLSLIHSLMLAHYERANYYGTPSRTYIPKLAWADIYVYENIAFECKSRNIPGVIYKNNRSGEVLMLADENNLYDSDGYRLSLAEEQELLRIREEEKGLVREGDLENEEYQNPESLQATSTLPEGVWDTKLFRTETGGFIGNVFESNGRARNTVRIFDASQWTSLITDSIESIQVFLPDESRVNEEDFFTALKHAYHYFLARGKKMPAVFLYSFLLDPELKEYLEEDSPLVDLIEHFRLFSIPDDKNQVLQYLFPRAFKSKNIKDWNAENPLQEAIKKMALDGKWIRSFGGYIILDDLHKLLQDENNS